MVNGNIYRYVGIYDSTNDRWFGINIGNKYKPQWKDSVTILSETDIQSVVKRNLKFIKHETNFDGVYVVPHICENISHDTGMYHPIWTAATKLKAEY